MELLDFKIPNLIDILVKNPIYAIGFLVIILVVVIMISMYRSFKPEKWILYLSESERIGAFLNIREITTRALKTRSGKENLTFFRNTNAYNVARGKKNVTLWLGKRGTAYTMKPHSTPKGKAIKIGSLWEGLQSLWDEKLCNDLKPEYKEPLMKSDFFIAVELEEGLTPKGLPTISEKEVYDEADEGMANLIGRRVRDEIGREDWIRNGGFVAIGCAVTLLLYQLGIL